VSSQWELVEPSRRNEALDTVNYAAAAAMRKGWASMTEEDWHRLDLERGIAPVVPGDAAQADLFDAAVKVVADQPAAPVQPADAKSKGQNGYWGDRPKTQKKRWF
jgi:phage terminase large subunit GpA-like protein